LAFVLYLAAFVRYVCEDIVLFQRARSTRDPFSLEVEEYAWRTTLYTFFGLVPIAVIWVWPSLHMTAWTAAFMLFAGYQVIVWQFAILPGAKDELPQLVGFRAVVNELQQIKGLLQRLER
jgi:uncharacterized membrane protein